MSASATSSEGLRVVLSDKQRSWIVKAAKLRLVDLDCYINRVRRSDYPRSSTAEAALELAVNERSSLQHLVDKLSQ